MTSNSAPTPTTEETTARTTGRLRRWFAAGVVGLTLGALLLGGTALAQSDADGDDPDQSFIERLAGKLGLTSDELVATIKETRIEMVDEAVADGRLTESQGEALRERIENADGSFLSGLRDRAVGRYAWGQLDITLDTVAVQLQMSTDELRAELEAGATLEEVIVAQGTTVDAVVAALVADAETTLAVAVADGELTQDQADRILENLPERLTRMIEHGLPRCHHHWSGGDESDAGAEEMSSQL